MQAAAAEASRSATAVAEAGFHARYRRGMWLILCSRRAGLGVSGRNYVWGFGPWGTGSIHGYSPALPKSCHARGSAFAAYLIGLSALGTF